MSSDAWPSPEAQPGPLPRIEDLPIAEQGYEQDAVRAEYPEAFFGSYEPLELGPEHVGFVRGGRVKVVVPLRPGAAVEGGEDDLLPEFPQELSLVR